MREGYLRAETSLTGYYERESILQLPTLSPEELAHGYDRFQELKKELLLKKKSPWRYQLYRLANTLRGGAQGILSPLRARAPGKSNT